MLSADGRFYWVLHELYDIPMDRRAAAARRTGLPEDLIADVLIGGSIEVKPVKDMQAVGSA
jgi:hypothetical protein